mmetsp:Transcript_36411/g.102853  ORF Transcript_36411/g.102853 Transcript_36411/m.102853 type:complete len:199 (-) Transcript_36411:182-778(-)|eukprot:CAMPEP_0117672676 /NCGR_PEP_ID=MMETSP0804-20121206/14041_1 /TAXON_ID=1074897 /ORGANISM="Tetraselmis astigmatica, Strain CCMP880" /LENGTH=198 /DNA_ID=CAMNT_0005481313 /DNA_START=132 /DNA_END=728 /DNA_ORIENTATION=-
MIAFSRFAALLAPELGGSSSLSQLAPTLAARAVSQSRTFATPQPGFEQPDRNLADAKLTSEETGKQMPESGVDSTKPHDAHFVVNKGPGQGNIANDIGSKATNAAEKTAESAVSDAKETIGHLEDSAKKSYEKARAKTADDETPIDIAKDIASKTANAASKTAQESMAEAKEKMKDVQDFAQKSYEKAKKTVKTGGQQ